MLSSTYLSFRLVLKGENYLFEIRTSDQRLRCFLMHFWCFSARAQRKSVVCCVVYLPRWGTTSSAKLHHQRCTSGAGTGRIQLLLPSASPGGLLQPSHSHPQEREQRKFQLGVGRKRADPPPFEKSLVVDFWSNHAERAVGLNQPPQGMRRASPANDRDARLYSSKLRPKAIQQIWLGLWKKEEGKRKKKKKN